MKVLLLNTYDQFGGAARASLRLLEGLIATGIDAELLVREKTVLKSEIHASGSRHGGRLRALFDYFPLKFYSRRQKHNFSLSIMPTDSINAIDALAPDIVNLHWIPQGFFKIEDLSRISSPIIWTLHDSWPFTGGCHLPGECIRYQQACGCCRALGSCREVDLSHWVWKRKKNNITSQLMAFVAPSRWMAERAKSSSLLANAWIEVIPNGLDTEVYSMGNRATAKLRFGFPSDRHLILYGACHALRDNNKGFDLLLEGLRHFCQQERNAELVIFGGNQDEKIQNCSIPVRNMGEIRDEMSLVDLYRAADVFVLPSRQENLPNVIMEAMACGTPCVAFNIGGLPDLIEHGKTGYLAHPYEPEDLGRGIAWLLSSDAMRQEIAWRARESICANFSLEKVAAMYVNLYQRILAV